MKSLFEYTLSPSVRAFSTTRVSPFDTELSDGLQRNSNYAAFNVTHYCGDNEAHVAKNRKWLCEELGIQEAHLIVPHQTHTANVFCVTTDFLLLSDAEKQSKLENVDAVITDLHHVCIGVSTADCVPILICDDEHEAVAAIHAGWRGTVNCIVCSTIEAMNRHFGTQPAQVKVVMGPCISWQAFEVGDEVVQQFLDNGFPQSVLGVLRHAGVNDVSAKPHIDLCAANAWLFETLGVPLEHIQISGICTYANYDTFFSARRLGIQSGRIFTGICRK